MLEMLCRPGPISRQKYATSYGRQIISKGYPHCVKQRQMFLCEECGSELAMEYMAFHI